MDLSKAIWTCVISRLFSLAKGICCSERGSLRISNLIPFNLCVHGERRHIAVYPIPYSYEVGCSDVWVWFYSKVNTVFLETLPDKCYRVITEYSMCYVCDIRGTEGGSHHGCNRCAGGLVSVCLCVSAFPPLWRRLLHCAPHLKTTGRINPSSPKSSSQVFGYINESPINTSPDSVSSPFVKICVLSLSSVWK